MPIARRCYASFYQEVVLDCKKNGQFDVVGAYTLHPEALHPRLGTPYTLKP